MKYLISDEEKIIHDELKESFNSLREEIESIENDFKDENFNIRMSAVLMSDAIFDSLKDWDSKYYLLKSKYEEKTKEMSVQSSEYTLKKLSHKQIKTLLDGGTLTLDEVLNEK